MKMRVAPDLRVWRRAVIVLGAVGAALVVGLILLLPCKEPSYGGKPLSVWIDQLPATMVTTNGAPRAYPAFARLAGEAPADQAELRKAAAAARDAIRNVGSECLPSLLMRLSTTRDSQLRGHLVGWGFRLHVLKPSSRLAWSDEIVRGQAVTGILELGDPARVAVPELVVMAGSTDSGVSLSARYVLERLAPQELRRRGMLDVKM